MPKLEALIFDLDGTLLNSAADLRQAINTTLRQHNREELSLKEVRDITGDGMLAMVNRAFMATGETLTPEQANIIFNEFIGHYATLKPDRGQLYPNVIEMLDSYRAAGIKLALCTNKQAESTLRLMRELNLSNYFDFIAGGDTFRVRKPHAGHIKGILDALGIHASAAVMVGDSHNDIIAAKGAGVSCIIVAHGYGNNMDEAEAQSIITNFLELPQALKEIGF